MSASSQRLSQSLSSSWTAEPVSLNFITAPAADSKEWIKDWKGVLARDLIHTRVVSVDAETSVEDACDILLSEDIYCLAVKSLGTHGTSYVGLFDFSDVNAFLTLAATRHTLQPDDLRYNPRADEIVSAARSGRVPVHLVSNFSGKNPLQTVPNDATVVSLLEIFSRGTHRTLIESSTSNEYLGMVSDRGLLSWFSSYAAKTPSLQKFLTNSLCSFALPSLNLYDAIVASAANSTVLDAMKLMSEEGVSSVAVLDHESGNLLSAVSVTDIGKIVVPSESKHILSTPLYQFVSLIKQPDGATDGVDKYPVYSVLSSNSLLRTVQKLLATNAHRLFVTTDSGSGSPVLSPSTVGNLSGIVSIVDILSIFARLANISDVDPTRMQRHRRASSASSQSDRDPMSMSNSRTSIRRSPSLILPPMMGTDSTRNSISGLDSLQRVVSWKDLTEA